MLTPALYLSKSNFLSFYSPVWNENPLFARTAQVQEDFPLVCRKFFNEKLYWENTIEAFVSLLKTSLYCLSKNERELPFKRKTRSGCFDEWNKMSLQSIRRSPALSESNGIATHSLFFILLKARKWVFITPNVPKTTSIKSSYRI